MKLRDRSISKFEIETLFRDVFNQDQIENVANFLKLVGGYVFLDREMIDILAVKHFGAKIGMSYMQRAVNHNLVSEIQTEGDFEKFYFQLKSGGIIFLNQINHPLRKFPLDAARKERERILAINQYLIENDYLLQIRQPQWLYEPLFVNENTVLFHYLSEEEVVRLLMKGLKIEDPEVIYDMFEFREMILKNNIRLNNKAKGNEMSHL